ncbi:MAG: sugar phosphate nucleotidyltransferase [Pseudonocardiaceae bacterium]
MPNHPPVHGILLLGGSGSRMRDACTGNKHLIPIAGRPMADYGLELLNRCGTDTITAVVRPEDEPAFRHLFTRSPWGPVIHIVIQPRPAGTADALQRCADLVEQPLVATLWGDNLFEYVPQTTIQRFTAHPSACMITVTTADDPRHFSTVTVEHGKVTSVIDKPARPTTNTVCTGLMLFESSALFEALPAVPPNARGERDMMHAVRQFATAGALTFDTITGCWFDAAVSPLFLRETELFALRRGFNHSINEPQETRSWTSRNRRIRSGSSSTPPGAAS